MIINLISQKEAHDLQSWEDVTSRKRNAMPKILRKKRAKQKPSKKIPRKKQQLQKSAKIPYDLEDLLVEMIISKGEKAINGTDIENLIYGTTAGLGILGYGHGFSVGRSLTLKLGNSTPLTSILDRIGLHDSLYYPFNDKVIITSRTVQRSTPPRIGRNIHLYEAGVIAGYLSTSTGVHITTEETRCVYNGANECQFCAMPLTSKSQFYGNGINHTANAVAAAFIDNKYSKINNEYYRVLTYLPLTDARISEQVLKLMLIVGERIGSAKGINIVEMILNISNYFGVKATSTEKKGRKTIIILRYESYNSLQAFVAIPAAIITGLVKSTGRHSEVHFTTNNDGTYTTKITIDKKSV